MSPDVNNSLHKKLQSEENNFKEKDYDYGTTFPKRHHISEVTSEKIKRKFNWFYFIVIGYTHLGALIGIYLAVTNTKWQTFIFSFTLHVLGVLGISGGAHRLWSHRSFRAMLPLEIMLMMFNSIAFQNSIYTWARDHRVHHKYQDTNADPYNINKGFWYAHITWLFYSKHPEVLEKGKKLDFSDLKEDAVVMFQHKNYLALILLLCILLPTIIPWYFWEESLLTSWHVAYCLRHCIILHLTFSVNSFAHLYGNRPYDKSIHARENNFVNLLTFGEGWHNYHHAFPWDYRSSEIYCSALTTTFIDFMAKVGWAYDLKTTSADLVKKRMLRTGDDSGRKEIWGWKDKDISEEDKKEAVIFN